MGLSFRIGWRGIAPVMENHVTRLEAFPVNLRPSLLAACPKLVSAAVLTGKTAGLSCFRHWP